MVPTNDSLRADRARTTKAAMPARRRRVKQQVWASTAPRRPRANGVFVDRTNEDSRPTSSLPTVAFLSRPDPWAGRDSIRSSWMKAPIELDGLGEQEDIL